MKKNAGLTLMELMVTTFILSVGVLAAIGSYQYITKSIQHSKGRTLANNLAQEQIEKLKNLSYYTLLVTTATHTDAAFTPPLYYDRGYYPPATIVEGGITYSRATRIDFAMQNGSSISTMSHTTDDTALKQITVYVMWREEGSWKSTTMQSLFANAAAQPLKASATGKVTKASGGNLQNAYVQVVDNSNWYGYTDSSGDYRFSVSEGSYTVQASSNGYYSATTTGYKSFSSGSSTTSDFTLTAISSSPVTGYIYKTDHLVISQVVGSSTSPSNCDQEWVEVYNPSTYTWTMATGAVAPIFDIYYDRQGGGGAVLIPMTFNRLTIPANGFFLFANVNPVVANGASVTADATYDACTPGGASIIQVFEDGGVGNNAAGVRLVRRTTGATIDEVGWESTSGGTTPPYFEGLPISQGRGLDQGEQVYRMTYPGSFNLGHGPAYDSNQNNLNFFIYPTDPIFGTPSNSLSPIKNPISGTPATGAVVRMNDLLNNSATCNATTIGAYSVCQFNLRAATGTWTMDVSSGVSASLAYLAQIQNVTVQTAVSTTAPNGATSPSWAAVSSNTVTLLRSTTDFALVSGRIMSGTGVGLSGIRVTDGFGRYATSSTNGLYNLVASTGSVVLTANPNDSAMNRAYTFQANLAEVFEAGMLYERDFTLELGGIIRGYFQTSANTPLPTRVAQAVKTSGGDTAEAASESSGYFYIPNLSTGTYTVTPLLDSMESASPATISVTMASTGTTTSVSTFTITSGIAQITGQVSVISGGSTTTIKTGALIVASTTTIASALPPAQTGATGAACSPCYYLGSSDATGNYTLYVRSSATPYQLYGWYSTVSGTTSSVTKAGAYAVNVSTPGQIVSQNITW